MRTSHSAEHRRAERSGMSPAEVRGPLSGRDSSSSSAILMPATHELAPPAQQVATPIVDQSYGSRDFTLRDLEGHLWGFGTYDMSRGNGEPTIFLEIRYRDPEAAATWLRDAIGFKRTLDSAWPGRLAEACWSFGSTPARDDRALPLPVKFPIWSHCANLRSPIRTRTALAPSRRRKDRARAADRAYGARVLRDTRLRGFLWWVSDYRPAS